MFFIKTLEEKLTFFLILRFNFFFEETKNPIKNHY